MAERNSMCCILKSIMYTLLTAIILYLPCQESHGRTMASLNKTEENLSASLSNVTTLENSLSAAGEKYMFMQKLRDFVSVICTLLQVWVF